MSKIVSVNWPDDLYLKLKEKALEEGRTFSNYVVYLCTKGLKIENAADEDENVRRFVKETTSPFREDATKSSKSAGPIAIEPRPATLLRRKEKKNTDLKENDC